MVDDIHERSVNTDIILGLLKKYLFIYEYKYQILLILIIIKKYRITKKRADLRLIISSATLDAEAIRNYYEDE